MGSSTEILTINTTTRIEEWTVTETAEDKTAPAVVDETVYIAADDLIALAPASDLSAGLDEPLVESEPEQNQSATETTQNEDSDLLYITGGLGVAGAAFSAYWWQSRSKSEQTTKSEPTEQLQCPNCESHVQQESQSAGDLCPACGGGYLSADGEGIDLGEF